MREVISVHLGQCGNQIASRFWTKISQQHGINKSGNYVGKDPEIELRYGGVFFREGSDAKYTPRAVLIDTEASAVNSILRDNFNDFYSPQNIVLQNNGAGNSWATGYEIGASLSGIGSHVFDVVRAEIETCDSLQGFQMTHALGGGTGSGFGSWLYETLRDELPGVIFTSYSVAQSKVSNVVVEPYNSVLSLNTLQEDVDGVHLFDNDALARLCTDKLGIANPTFDDFNELISEVMSGMTCSLRYPGQHNTSLRKQMTNLMPDPRYHFYMVAQAPLSSRNTTIQNGSATEVIGDVLKSQNMMLSSTNRKSEKILAAAVILRGSVAMREIEEATSQIQLKEPYRFADYLANSIQTSACNVSPVGVPLSATCVVNSSLVSDSLSETLDAANILFVKRAYLHYYKNTVCNSQCIEQCLSAVESVYRDYIDLECLAPSDKSLRKPRAMSKRTDEPCGDDDIERWQHGQEDFDFKQAFMKARSTTTSSIPNSLF